ncbi:hypothetical protein, partial [Turicimonas muris]
NFSPSLENIHHSHGNLTIEGVKNKVKLYLKTGEQELEKPESSCSKSVDLNQEAEKVMAVFGVEPLPTLTTVVDITKRLGVRLPI